MDYAFLWIFMHFKPKFLWIKDFYRYVTKILKNMDFGMDIDLVSNHSGPTDYVVRTNKHNYYLSGMAVDLIPVNPTPVSPYNVFLKDIV